MQVAPISFSIPAKQYEVLRTRAAILNIRPAEYARRLFDAAYYVRCVAEKGGQAEDIDLDRQVRQVFLLADCEPDYIADAIGMPVERVTRILEGWRQAAKELLAGKNRAGNAKPPQPEQPRGPAVVSAPAESVSGAISAPHQRDPRSVAAWPDETIEQVRRLWAEGLSIAEIAERIGKTRKAVEQFAYRFRHICPSRRRS